jgi:hypothetical protein
MDRIKHSGEKERNYHDASSFTSLGNSFMSPKPNPFATQKSTGMLQMKELSDNNSRNSS